MFFPDSLIFYKINDISKEIVEKFNIDLNIYIISLEIYYVRKK